VVLDLRDDHDVPALFTQNLPRSTRTGQVSRQTQRTHRLQRKVRAYNLTHRTHRKVLARVTLRAMRTLRKFFTQRTHRKRTACVKLYANILLALLAMLAMRVSRLAGDHSKVSEAIKHKELRFI